MSSQRHSIGPHPDLPTITEDILESEEDSITNSPQQHDNIIDDTQSDSGSKISHANSYAFTLDGVGFDEENSLISGLCSGSVLQVDQPSSSELTRPQNNTRVKSKEREVEHRQARRKLDMPWSHGVIDDDDHNNGASSSNTAKNGHKSKWPWPDMTGKLSTPPTLETLDETMRNYAQSIAASAKRRRANNNCRWNMNSRSAMITMGVLIALCLIAIFATAISSTHNYQDGIEAEVLVMEGNPRPRGGQIMPRDIDSIGTVETNTHKSNESEEVITGAASHFVDALQDSDCITDMCHMDLSQSCSLKYKYNTPTNVIPVNTITLELSCKAESWIGIGFSNDGQMIGSEAVLGVPEDEPQKYIIGGKSGNSVVPMPAHQQTLMDASVHVTRRGHTVMKFTKIMSEQGEIELVSGENTLLYAQGIGIDLGYHAFGESFTLTLPDVEEGDVEEAESVDVLDEEYDKEAAVTTTEESSEVEEIEMVDADSIEELPEDKTVEPVEEEIIEEEENEQTSVEPIEEHVENAPVEASIEELDSSCVDQPGKFMTSKNKSRSCRWMLKAGDTLYSPVQDRECGVQVLGTKPSILGFNCRYACRAYNGCLYQNTHDVSIGVGEEVESTPIDEEVESMPIDQVELPTVDEETPASINVVDDNEDTVEANETEDKDEVGIPCADEVCNLQLSHSCLLKYKVNSPTIVISVGTITLELICEGESWIGIGFSNDGQMIGSEAVLGVPGDEPQKYMLGGKDNTSVVPMPEQKQTLMDASVAFDSGLTILKFTKIMKEQGEIAIVPGENILLYAQGMGVDLGYHNVAESFLLSLPSVVEDTFTDGFFNDAEEGILRPCSWLDFRNGGRRKIRRDANCYDELTQAACPDSCSAYVVVTETQSRNETQDIDSIISMPQDIALMRAPVSITQDDCYDAVGFFLDSNSTVRECGWLSSNPDPLDETRKISNCGYLKEPTDLGRMCKLSCGMCDW